MKKETVKRYFPSSTQLKKDTTDFKTYTINIEKIYWNYEDGKYSIQNNEIRFKTKYTYIGYLYVSIVFRFKTIFTNLQPKNFMFNCFVFPILQHIIDHLEYNPSTAFIIIHIYISI